MRTSVVVLLAEVLVSLAFAAGCAENEEAREDATDQATEQDAQRTGKETTEERTKARTGGSTQDAMLEMGGDSGIEFSGSCTVGDEETEVSGRTPNRFTLELKGQRLDCEIRKESTGGNLKLVFTAGENTRSVQQISGGTINLTYENGQVSFSSSSSGSGGQVVSSSQVSSSSQSSSSSSVKVSP